MRSRKEPREGDFTINPTTGKILKAGSSSFNEALIEGKVDKIFFKVPGDKAAVCDYVLDKDKLHISPKQSTKHKPSPDFLASVRDIIEQYKTLRKLQEKLSKLPHGKV
jgi:hypothetical protein